MKKLILLQLILLAALSSKATVWHVGATQTYTMPSQVATLVANGDTVNIDAGIYNSNVCAWTADNLLLRCINGIAHLKSNGLSYGDKGIWVIQGKNTRVDHIEFSLCTSTSGNGAGIRQEGQNVIISNCYFHDNQNGILTNQTSPCRITIEYCEFSMNGTNDGISHNVYIGKVDTLIFRYNYSHMCKAGHELKSRAITNYILYNRFSNETGTTAQNIDLSNGGLAIIMGNVIQKGINSTNTRLISYGLEGLTNPAPHNFYLVNNTLINDRPSGSFLNIGSGTALYKGYNNIFAGAGSLLNGTATTLDTLQNKNYTVPSTVFANAAAYDYHLLASVSAINTATNAGSTSNGFILTPVYEYMHPANRTIRTAAGLMDIGAYEYGLQTSVATENPEKDLKIFIENDNLTLQLTGEKYTVHIFNLEGKMIYENKNYQDSNKIPVSVLKNDIYIVNIVTANGAAINKKIIIQ